jgi:hypothetical protein
MVDVVVSEVAAEAIAAAINAQTTAQVEEMNRLTINVGLCAESLADILIALKTIKNSQEKMVGTLNEVSSTVKQQTQTMHDQALVQNMVAVDQIKNNAIQQAETKAALNRAGLESAPLPDVGTLVKQTLTDTTAMRGLTEFQSSVANYTSEKLQQLVAYIKDTKVYTAGAELLDSMITDIKTFILGIPDLFKPTDLVDVATAEARKVESQATSGSAT